MEKPFNPPILEFGSKAYAELLERTQEAVQAQNRRNRHTVCLKRNGVSPFKEEPPKPTRLQLNALKSYRAWMDGMKNQTDQWWFDRIDAAIEENFYRAYVHQILWWDRCDHESLDNDAWKARFAGWDFDRALETDWDLVEYAIHCAGYPPFKAHTLAFQCSDRKKWLENRAKVYLCFECDHEMTGLDRAPEKCRKCFTVGSVEELS